MEIQSVVWGSGVVKRCRQPLAAHSPVINDHPCGSDSGPREKQKWSLLSESNGNCVQGLDTGAKMACVVFCKIWLGILKYQCFVAIVIYCWDGVVQGYRVLMLSLYLFEKGAWCSAHCKVCRTHSGVGPFQPLICQESYTHKLGWNSFSVNVVTQVFGWRSVHLVAVVHNTIYWLSPRWQ